MTDLVERLRERADNCDPDWRPNDHRLWREAADEIERLRGRVAALEAREKMLAMEGRTVHGGWPDVASEAARAARNIHKRGET